jgi:hypothetical protein
VTQPANTFEVFTFRYFSNNFILIAKNNFLLYFVLFVSSDHYRGETDLAVKKEVFNDTLKAFYWRLSKVEEEIDNFQARLMELREHQILLVSSFVELFTQKLSMAFGNVLDC